MGVFIQVQSSVSGICNNGLSQQSAIKLPDSVLNTLPKTKEFYSSFLTKIFSFRLVFTLHSRMLRRMMNIYIRNLSEPVAECISRPNRASNLKNVFSSTIMLFHTMMQDIRNPIDVKTNLSKMSELVAMYIDLEISASKTGQESYQKIASKVTSALFLCLEEDIDIILDTIMKCNSFHVKHEQLWDLIFRRVLRDSPPEATYDTTFIRYIFCYKLWKSITTAKEKRKQITNLACLKLQLTPAVKELLGSRNLKSIFPKFNKKCNDIVKFLLNVKIPIRERTKLFLQRMSCKFKDDPQLLENMGGSPNDSPSNFVFLNHIDIDSDEFELERPSTTAKYRSAKADSANGSTSDRVNRQNDDNSVHSQPSCTEGKTCSPPIYDLTSPEHSNGAEYECEKSPQPERQSNIHTSSTQTSPEHSNGAEYECEQSPRPERQSNIHTESSPTQTCVPHHDEAVEVIDLDDSQFVERSCSSPVASSSFQEINAHTSAKSVPEHSSRSRSRSRSPPHLDTELSIDKGGEESEDEEYSSLSSASRSSSSSSIEKEFPDQSKTEGNSGLEKEVKDEISSNSSLDAHSNQNYFRFGENEEFSCRDSLAEERKKKEEEKQREHKLEKSRIWNRVFRLQKNKQTQSRNSIDDVQNSSEPKEEPDSSSYFDNDLPEEDFYVKNGDESEKFESGINNGSSATNGFTVQTTENHTSSNELVENKEVKDTSQDLLSNNNGYIHSPVDGENLNHNLAISQLEATSTNVCSPNQCESRNAYTPDNLPKNDLVSHTDDLHENIQISHENRTSTPVEMFQNSESLSNKNKGDDSFKKILLHRNQNALTAGGNDFVDLRVDNVNTEPTEPEIFMESGNEVEKLGTDGIKIEYEPINFEKVESNGILDIIDLCEDDMVINLDVLGPVSELIIDDSLPPSSTTSQEKNNEFPVIDLTTEDFPNIETPITSEDIEKVFGEMHRAVTHKESHELTVAEASKVKDKSEYFSWLSDPDLTHSKELPSTSSIERSETFDHRPTSSNILPDNDCCVESSLNKDENLNQLHLCEETSVPSASNRTENEALKSHILSHDTTIDNPSDRENNNYKGSEIKSPCQSPSSFLENEGSSGIETLKALISSGDITLNPVVSSKNMNTNIASRNIEPLIQNENNNFPNDISSGNAYQVTTQRISDSSEICPSSINRTPVGTSQIDLSCSIDKNKRPRENVPISPSLSLNEGSTSSILRSIMEEVYNIKLFKLRFLPDNLSRLENFGNIGGFLDAIPTRPESQVLYDPPSGGLYLQMYGHSIFVPEALKYLIEIRKKFLNDYSEYSNKIDSVCVHITSLGLRNAITNGNEELHILTVKQDCTIFLIQNEYRNKYIDRSLSYLQALIYSLNHRVRCTCEPCVLNNIVLLSNNHVLHELHILFLVSNNLAISKLVCNEIVRDQGTNVALPMIEDSSRRTESCDSTALPIKKRRTLSTCSSTGSDKQQEISYPPTPMISIAQIHDAVNYKTPNTSLQDKDPRVMQATMPSFPDSQLNPQTHYTQYPQSMSHVNNTYQYISTMLENQRKNQVAMYTVNNPPLPNNVVYPTQPQNISRNNQGYPRPLSRPATSLGNNAQPNRDHLNNINSFILPQYQPYFFTQPPFGTGNPLSGSSSNSGAATSNDLHLPSTSQGVPNSNFYPTNGPPTGSGVFEDFRNNYQYFTSPSTSGLPASTLSTANKGVRKNKRPRKT